jgi:argonaute-like protein implicated in RNA metabolism and viral defense
VKDNWNAKVATPYNEWDTKQLQSYLAEKGVETKDTAADNTDSLISRVKSVWYEAEDKAEDAWSSVKDWVFDSWTGKQCAYHKLYLY